MIMTGIAIGLSVINAVGFVYVAYRYGKHAGQQEVIHALEAQLEAKGGFEVVGGMLQVKDMLAKGELGDDVVFDEGADMTLSDDDDNKGNGDLFIYASEITLSEVVKEVCTPVITNLEVINPVHTAVNVVLKSLNIDPRLETPRKQKKAVHNTPPLVMPLCKTVA